MIYTVGVPYFPILLSPLFTPAKTVTIFVCNSKNDLETALNLLSRQGETQYGTAQLVGGDSYPIIMGAVTCHLGDS